MEEKQKENTQANKEEISLCLTFNPEEMQKKIVELSEEIKQLRMENEMCNLIITDAEVEIAYMQSKMPKSFLSRVQDCLLDWFGGNYEN